MNDILLFTLLTVHAEMATCSECSAIAKIENAATDWENHTQKSKEYANQLRYNSAWRRKQHPRHAQVQKTITKATHTTTVAVPVTVTNNNNNSNSTSNVISVSNPGTPTPVPAPIITTPAPTPAPIVTTPNPIPAPIVTKPAPTSEPSAIASKA